MLVAIAIPVFTNQLEKSRDAVTTSNVRAAYAEAASAYLTSTTGGNATYNSDKTVTVKNVVVKGESENGGFDSTDLPFTLTDDLKTALDKAANDTAKNTGISVKFTWDEDDGTVSADVA